MESDERLADVLSEFARTMMTDVPIQEILDRLVARIVEVAPITAAAVTLIGMGGGPRYVAASSGLALKFECLQNNLGQGPCLVAYQTGKAVAVPDLGRDDRFPRFTHRLQEEGLAAAFAFPLRAGDNRMGALALYRNAPGLLDPATTKAAQTLADVTAAYLLNAATRADLQSSLERSRESALHDPLTGLANRTLLFESLDKVLARHRLASGLICILYFDLDNFKMINDAHGHRIGDELLVSITGRLKRLMRPGDTLARLAGDEFVILCPDLKDRSEAELIAARVISTLGKTISLSIGNVEARASIGIALAESATVVSDDLLHDADVAMYQAKRGGGGRYQIFNPGERRLIDRVTGLHQGLRRSS
ncbi:MAG TPA: sensor domain-containing diguanylate cyclase [Acidimicrobiales bacterium]|nr:sensor domain-containing diguanylate cyclase [Acidimicrobiales bacterium]